MYQDDHGRYIFYPIHECFSVERSELKPIGEDVADSKITSIVLNRFPDSWEPFIQSVCGWVELPKFEDIWVDCVQEESRKLSRNSLDEPRDEGTQVLVAHAKRERGKGKGRKYLWQNSERRSPLVQKQKK